MFILSEELKFPPPSYSDTDGLLCIGGDLSTKRLLLAYQHGIFPWYNEDEPIQWYCPNPRFVLFPEKLKISKSMQSVIKKGTYKFKINTAFEQVIAQCKSTSRKGVEGTWITNELKDAFCCLHKLGYAYSAECWLEGELVGGLYGIKINQVFCGESMFSLKNNASKFALIHFVKALQSQGIRLIDCQVFTEHLERLGAEFISREKYLNDFLLYT